MNMTEYKGENGNRTQLTKFATQMLCVVCVAVKVRSITHQTCVVKFLLALYLHTQNEIF